MPIGADDRLAGSSRELLDDKLMLAGIVGHLGGPEQSRLASVFGALVWFGFVVTTISGEQCFSTAVQLTLSRDRLLAGWAPRGAGCAGIDSGPVSVRRLISGGPRVKTAILLVALLGLTGAALAQDANAPGAIPPPKDVPYTGTIRLDVDATDTIRHIFRVRETIPVTPGALTLLYPRWLPGNHSPSGRIEQLTGLSLRAGGARLQWTRDPVDVYAFRVHVPNGRCSAARRWISRLQPRPMAIRAAW